MKNFKIATVLMLLCVCSSVFAQETKTDRAVRAVKELCLTGKQFDLKADAKGNLILRKLLPGGEGEVSVNVRESSGAAAIFDEKFRQIADEDIRRCIQPHIKQIIDAILVENPKPSTEQDLETIKLAINFVKQACLRGEDVELVVKGDGVFALSKSGVAGEFDLSYRDIPRFAMDAKEETRASL